MNGTLWDPKLVKNGLTKPVLEPGRKVPWKGRPVLKVPPPPTGFTKVRLVGENCGCTEGKRKGFLWLPNPLKPRTGLVEVKAGCGLTVLGVNNVGWFEKLG